MEMRIEAIGYNSEVEALLAQAGLPVSDLPNNSRLNLLGLWEGDRLVGVVGIEVYEGVGLLRSLAVSESHRRGGLGRQLVSEAETWAAGQGIKDLYLLTTTAADFFARLGYRVIPRTEAPAAIATTTQFADLCPASSTFMRKSISTKSLR